MENKNNNESQITTDNISDTAIFDKEYADAQNKDSPHLIYLQEFEKHLSAEDTAKIRTALEAASNNEIIVKDKDGCIFKIKDNKVQEINASENSDKTKGRFHFSDQNDKIKLKYSYREKTANGFQKNSIKYKENENNGSYKYKQKEVHQTNFLGLTARKTNSTKVKADEDSKVVTSKHTESQISSSLLILNDYHVEQHIDTQKYEKDANDEWEKVKHRRSISAADVGVSRVAGSYEKTNINSRQTDIDGKTVDITQEKTVGIGVNLTSSNVSMKREIKETCSSEGEKLKETYQNLRFNVGLGISTDIEAGSIDYTTNSSNKKQLNARFGTKGIHGVGLNISTENQTENSSTKTRKGLVLTDKTVRLTNETIASETKTDQTGKKEIITNKKGGSLYFNYANPIKNLGKEAIKAVILGRPPKVTDLKTTLKTQAQEVSKNSNSLIAEESVNQSNSNLKETLKAQTSETDKSSIRQASATEKTATAAELQNKIENTDNEPHKQPDNAAMLYAQMQKLRERR